MRQTALIVLFIFLLNIAPATSLNLNQLQENFKSSPAPAPETLPYNRVQLKASHNSYERDEDVAGQLDFNSHDTYQGGCRALEFDCRQDKKRIGAFQDWRWSVQHDGDYSEDHDQLRTWLNRVRDWGNENQNHDVITVHIELKDSFGEHQIFADKLDAMLLEHLAGGDREKLFTPGDMMKRGSGDSLVAVAAKAGWPTLKELQGKFIVVITGGDSETRGERKKHYARNPELRMAFVDKDVGTGEEDRYPSETSGDRIFLNLHVYQKHLAWHDFCHKAARHKGFVVRAWKVNHPLLWARCLAHGVNLLATDKIRNHSWARTGSKPFRVQPLH